MMYFIFRYPSSLKSIDADGKKLNLEGEVVWKSESDEKLTFQLFQLFDNNQSVFEVQQQDNVNCITSFRVGRFKDEIAMELKGKKAIAALNIVTDWVNTYPA